MSTRTYVVAYDVTDDDRRLLVARICSGYGRRVQYSVFECVLDELRQDEMTLALERAIDPCTDRLLIYGLCSPCSAAIRFMGRPLGGDDPALRTRSRIV